MSDESEKIEQLRSHMILCTSALLDAICALIRLDGGKQPTPGEITRRLKQIKSELPAP